MASHARARSGTQGLAARRIMRDLREMRADPQCGIWTGPASDADLYTWDLVMAAPTTWPLLTAPFDPASFWYADEDTKARGTATPPRVLFHFTLEFPRDYPTSPLHIKASTLIPHPNVYPSFICLDLLQEFVQGGDDGYRGGWSPSYSVQAILLNVQSFLFAEDVPQDHGGYRENRIAQSELRQCYDQAAAYQRTHQECFERLGVCCPPASAPANPTLAPNANANANADAAAEAASLAPGSGSGGAAAIGDLPDDVLALILGLLSDKDLSSASRAWPRFGAVVQEYSIRVQREMACFFTKESFRRNDLGVGLKLPGGSLKTIGMAFDLLSRDAFFDHGVRATAFGDAVDVWFPVLISKPHTDRVMPYLKGVIHVLGVQLEQARRTRQWQFDGCGGGHGQITGHYDGILRHGALFDPLHALLVIPRIMNNLVVALLHRGGTFGGGGGNGGNGSGGGPLAGRRHTAAAAAAGSQPRGRGGGSRVELMHHSENALLGYVCMHHTLLELVSRHPELQAEVEARVNSFVEDGDRRTKAHTPELGLFFMLFSLLPSEAWGRAVPHIVGESFDRQVSWLLKKSDGREDLAELAFVEEDDCCEYRLATTFEATRTGRSLLMFQDRFLRLVAPRTGETRSQQLQRYRGACGRPPQGTVEALQRSCGEILGVSSWEEYHACLGLPVPARAALSTRLKGAVRNSERKGYHFETATNRALQRRLEDKVMGGGVDARLRDAARRRLAMAPQKVDALARSAAPRLQLQRRSLPLPAAAATASAHTRANPPPAAERRHDPFAGARPRDERRLPAPAAAAAAAAVSRHGATAAAAATATATAAEAPRSASRQPYDPFAGARPRDERQWGAAHRHGGARQRPPHQAQAQPPRAVGATHGQQRDRQLPAPPRRRASSQEAGFGWFSPPAGSTDHH